MWWAFNKNKINKNNLKKNKPSEYFSLKNCLKGAD